MRGFSIPLASRVVHSRILIDLCSLILTLPCSSCTKRQGVFCRACFLRAASLLFSAERNPSSRLLVENADKVCCSRGSCLKACCLRGYLMPLALTAAESVSFLNPHGFCGFGLRWGHRVVGRSCPLIGNARVARRYFVSLFSALAVQR